MYMYIMCNYIQCTIYKSIITYIYIITCILCISFYYYYNHTLVILTHTDESQDQLKRL